MKLSLCLIAKNEANTVERCLASFWDHVDEVCLVDTGSTDGTLAIARKFAKRRGAPEKLKTAKFKWVNDFSAARKAAEELATGDWHTWADLDDVIEHPEELRKICAEQPENVSAVFFRYDYGRDDQGNCVCELWRERLVRAGKGEWLGRVHECQMIEGDVVQISGERCQWRHEKQAFELTRRNIDILEEWVKDDPTDQRVLTYLGSERGAHEDHAGAVEAFERFFALDPDQDDHYAQNARKLAGSLMAINRHQDAKRVALNCMALMPMWPDTYLTLAEVLAYEKRFPEAIHFARQTVGLGKPTTPLIVNPLDYTAAPISLIASCLAAMGKFDEAIEHAQQVLQLVPGHEALTAAVREWAQRAQREQAANTWCACVDILVRHDEQLKALAVLDTVPWFAEEHPSVVAKRFELRERLSWLDGGYEDHYETGGSKPEDFHDDETSMRIAGELPRAHVLLRGLS